MKQFDRKKIKVFPLNERKSNTNIKDVIIDPDNLDSCSEYFKLKDNDKIKRIAESIIKAKQTNKPIIITFGAHLIRNGLGLILRKMMEKGYITHLATNGAGPIHDWEIAFHGKTAEDVRENVKQGKFGTWDETGRNINQALIEGSREGKGYGESIAEMIHQDKFINHPYKKYSLLDAAFSNNIPITVHPGFGYDIIYTHPLCDGEAIGKTSEVDFLRFVETIYNLEGGVYISVGSAIMSPMIFEKALSMARNVAHQEGDKIEDFMIVVNDIQEGNWDWGSGVEPLKQDPAYYLRFCKSFDRMNSREMHYIKADNRDFLASLFACLQDLDK